MNAFIYSNVAAAAPLQKWITIPMVLRYSRSESWFSKMNRATRIAVWMLTYACSVLQNRCFMNRDLWIAVWKYPKVCHELQRTRNESFNSFLSNLSLSVDLNYSLWRATKKFRRAPITPTANDSFGSTLGPRWSWISRTICWPPPMGLLTTWPALDRPTSTNQPACHQLNSPSLLKP